MKSNPEATELPKTNLKETNSEGEKLTLTIEKLKTKINQKEIFKRNLNIFALLILSASMIIPVFFKALVGSFILLMPPTLLVLTALPLIYLETSISESKNELLALEAKIRVYSRFHELRHLKKESYFETLVEINTHNLEDYYTLVKVHTDNSFRVAIIAGIVGFLLIVIGLLTGFLNDKNTRTISFIASGAGIITEFIASVFFFLYNRTIKQLKNYHDSLIDVQNILLSFKLIGDISDDKEKAKMISQMLNSLTKKES